MDFCSAVRSQYVEAPGSAIEMGPACDRLKNEVHGFGCIGRCVRHASHHADTAVALQLAHRPTQVRSFCTSQRLTVWCPAPKFSPSPRRSAKIVPTMCHILRPSASARMASRSSKIYASLTSMRWLTAVLNAKMPCSVISTANTPGTDPCKQRRERRKWLPTPFRSTLRNDRKSNTGVSLGGGEWEWIERRRSGKKVR